MAAGELSIEAIHEYFVERGGIVANREVVKHFKRYLTDPATKGMCNFFVIPINLIVKWFCLLGNYLWNVVYT